MTCVKLECCWILNLFTTVRWSAISVALWERDTGGGNCAVSEIWSIGNFFSKKYEIEGWTSPLGKFKIKYVEFWSVMLISPLSENCSFLHPAFLTSYWAHIVRNANPHGVSRSGSVFFWLWLQTAIDNRLFTYCPPRRDLEVQMAVIARMT